MTEGVAMEMESEKNVQNRKLHKLKKLPFVLFN